MSGLPGWEFCVACQKYLPRQHQVTRMCDGGNSMVGIGADAENLRLRAALAAAEKERDRYRTALENIAQGAATHWSYQFARRALRPEAVAEGEKE